VPTFNREAGGVYLCYQGKRNLWRRGRMEVGAFCHEEEGCQPT